MYFHNLRLNNLKSQEERQKNNFDFLRQEVATINNISSSLQKNISLSYQNRQAHLCYVLESIQRKKNN